MEDNRKVAILIVDDKLSNIFALKEILDSPDRLFFTATDGNAALKIALKKSIDLILMDVQMPGMDGFEVASILKSNRRTSEIPVIFVTAEKIEPTTISKAFDGGAIDYLLKPLDIELTKAKVTALLKSIQFKKETTERKLAVEKHTLLINIATDIIAVIDPLTLKFEEVNSAVETILGFTVKDFIGTSMMEYLVNGSASDVEKLRYETREHFSFETRIYTSKKSIKWLKWEIYNKNGVWYTNAKDITEAKEGAELKNYLSIVVKQSNEAIYLHNLEGQIISWNKGAEKIYGFTEEEALRMKIWNFVPDALLEETQDIISGVLKGEQIQLRETKRITKYGKMIDVVFSASAIKDANKVLKSVAITEIDITKQKQAEQKITDLNVELKHNLDQLESTNKELESFSYSVSHDLRAPLRAINGFASIMQKEYNEKMDDEFRRLIGLIGANSVKMGVLIDDLLNFSRMGRKEIVKSKVSMTDLVKKVLSDQETDKKENLKISIGELKPVEGDYTLLFQVVFNLISNAIKYSSKKPVSEIEINSMEKDGEFVFYVKDNGSGFNMDYAHKLFGVFQRLHDNSEFEGTGVGLAIVKRIITKHGGNVWAEGIENEGATFYFSLPVYNKEKDKLN